MFSLFAFLLSFASLALLYLCWRESTVRPLLTLLAWLMMVASVPLWMIGSGVIFGVCLALIAISLQAWTLILVMHRPQTRKQWPTQPSAALHWRRGLRLLPAQTGLLLVSVPLAGLAAMQLTTIVTGWLPWHRVDLMALGIYTMPLVWGALSVWALADSRWWRPVVALVLICAVCSWGIYR